MPSPSEPRIGYVLKVYPRFSETFVVNEILAHERAGQELSIFSLRPPTGGRFHPDIGEVRAGVEYVPSVTPRGDGLWSALRERGAAGAAVLADDPDADDAGAVMQALALARAVDVQGLTHLHAHFGTLAAQVARLAARLTGVTYSFTAHAKDIFHADVEPARLRTRIADARAVITVSDFNLEHLSALVPAAAPRIHRVYNGLDLRRFGFRAYDDGRHGGIVAVGRLIEKKGFEDLIDAVALLAAAGRRVPCTIVGDGPLEDDLRARIAERGVGGHVQLLGPRTQSEVRELVGRAAVFAAPCVVGADGNRDGLPTVLLEALALGTPAIATPVTGIPELIRDGETGLLVGERDPAALAGALATVLDDPAGASVLAQAGRRLVEERFSVDENAARMRALAWQSAAPRRLAVAS